ncbi:phytosulfokines 3-like [Diospyros lotus]|uniref:phytosulfokines 3-like n=1 Tax=Diospyros lotus TaxID=55363 RepID=UPI00224E70CB|nr:phytosulfokines 3-like [Diospyros lotus]
MSGFTAVFLHLLLLSCLSSRATRPAPLAWKNTSPENQRLGDETGRPDQAVDHEDCEAGGDEECLMRRTLAAAHTDYIYSHPGPP